MDSGTTDRGTGVWAGVPMGLSALTLDPRLPFTARVRAAAAAGFDGIGLRVEDHLAARDDGLTTPAMLAVLREHGLTVLEVELLTDWGGSPPRAREEHLFAMARTFGVTHVNAALFQVLPARRVTEAFAALCERAGADLDVALELMPYAGVSDLLSAWHTVRDCGRPNAGLLIDTWHWARSGATREDLATVPAERVVAVRLSDVGSQPLHPMRQESLHHRLPPGHGCGHVAATVRELQRTACTTDGGHEHVPYRVRM